MPVEQVDSGLDLLFLDPEFFGDARPDGSRQETPPQSDVRDIIIGPRVWTTRLWFFKRFVSFRREVRSTATISRPTPASPCGLVRVLGGHGGSRFADTASRLLASTSREVTKTIQMPARTLDSAGGGLPSPSRH